MAISNYQKLVSMRRKMDEINKKRNMRFHKFSSQSFGEGMKQYFYDREYILRDKALQYAMELNLHCKLDSENIFLVKDADFDLDDKNFRLGYIMADSFPDELETKLYLDKGINISNEDTEFLKKFKDLYKFYDDVYENPIYKDPAIESQIKKLKGKK